MTFKKGYKQTEKHQLNAKLSRNKKYGSSVCLICGEKFLKYRKNQILCGKKDCSNKYTMRRYHSFKISDPIKHKAQAISGSIRLGIGKTEKIINLIKNNLGKQCKYCGEIMTLENLSLDHKIPRKHSKVYNRKLKKRIYSELEIQQLDRIENLQIICKKCNMIKGDFSDDQFTILSSFLDKHPDIRETLRIRLHRGILLFRHR